MTHLLDTNTCVDHLRYGAASLVSARLLTAATGSVGLCSIVVGELLFGARRSSQVAQNLARVQAFCNQFRSLPFDDPAAGEYSIIRAHLASLGTPIGPNDLFIAAIALAHGLTLVTHNTAEFSRVPGLTLEDWQTP
ncbi:MAG: type II toxin-antitoxin system VapC family toxin [Gemmataceae bacterium]|nr:type II toxin-antitoxin system VapC family toxin [Gemmataceae bacterium]